jgi:hypothetical protein
MLPQQTRSTRDTDCMRSACRLISWSCRRPYVVSIVKSPALASCRLTRRQHVVEPPLAACRRHRAAAGHFCIRRRRPYVVTAIETSHAAAPGWWSLLWLDSTSFSRGQLILNA